MRPSFLAMVIVVAVGTTGSAFSCWDDSRDDAVPVGTATPVPTASAADVCGQGWEFDEWREVQSYHSLESCRAGGTRQHCTRDGLLDVEWIGELEPCASATATPSAESICGAGWEFGETRDLQIIYADDGEGCPVAGTRGHCTKEVYFEVEWDGEDPDCASATATASAVSETPRAATSE